MLRIIELQENAAVEGGHADITDERTGGLPGDTDVKPGGLIEEKVSLDGLLKCIAKLDEAVFPSNIWGLGAYSESVTNSYDVLLAACMDADSTESAAHKQLVVQQAEADTAQSRSDVGTDIGTADQSSAGSRKAHLAGFALLRCFDDAELIRIAVDESMRRHGIGRALTERLISEAETRRVSSIFLEVRSSNLPAIAMYEAAGFTREGVRREYYSAPKEDALIMKYSCRES